MPDYKKRRVNRFQMPARHKNNKHIEVPEQDDIKMSPAGKKGKTKLSKPEKKDSSEFRVVNGKKNEQKRRFKGLVGVLIILAAITVTLELILPVGIIENAENAAAMIGSGAYPIELSSSEVLNAKSRFGYYYILTDTDISAFSNGGKEIYSHSHGFENPILKTSKTRALIFSQGGTELCIYNLSDIKSEITTKNEIITANISDSGSYAVVTQSDSYASVVSVYNKNDRLIYEWSSSADTVNNVVLSPNGKKIAVSCFNASSGKYSSSVKILNFDSATPVFTENLDNTLVFDLGSADSSQFWVITENSIEFINWSRYNKTNYNNDYSISTFKSSNSGCVAVFNRASDKTDNRIAVFSKNGQLKNQFDFKGIISDIEISNGHIYCISETEVFILSDKGETLRKEECGFGAVRLSVLGTDTVAVITDNKIEKLLLDKGEK